MIANLYDRVCADCGADYEAHAQSRSSRCPACREVHRKAKDRLHWARRRERNRDRINRLQRERYAAQREAERAERERAADAAIRRMRGEEPERDEEPLPPVDIPPSWVRVGPRETRGRPATQAPAKKRPGDPGTPEARAAVEAARYLVERMSNPYGKARSNG